MSKITASIRDQIVHNVETKTLAPRRAALNDQRSVLGRDLYLHFFAEKLDGAKGIPREFIFHGTEMKGIIVGDTQVFLLGDKPLPLPYQAHAHWNVFNLEDKDHSLARRYFDLQRERDQLEKDKRTLRGKARATIRRVSTIKRLKEIWPEVIEYLPEDTGENLPAVTVDMAAVIKELSRR